MFAVADTHIDGHGATDLSRRNFLYVFKRRRLRRRLAALAFCLRPGDAARQDQRLVDDVRRSRVSPSPDPTLQ
jgi:hypothetical protein